MKYLSSGIFFIALVLNIKISLDDPFVLMSEAVIAVTTSTTSGSTTSNSGVSGGFWPGFDETSRDCVLSIGGGGSGGVGGGIDINVSETPVSGWLFIGGSYYNPTAYQKGKKYICSWAWAACTPGDCVPV